VNGYRGRTSKTQVDKKSANTMRVAYLGLDVCDLSTSPEGVDGMVQGKGKHEKEEGGNCSSLRDPTPRWAPRTSHELLQAIRDLPIRHMPSTCFRQSSIVQSTSSFDRKATPEWWNKNSDHQDLHLSMSVSLARRDLYIVVTRS
jgi:hypothetical protein